MDRAPDATRPDASDAMTPARPAALGRTVVSIQFLRFFAAFAVVLFHAHQALSRGIADHPAALAYLFGVGASGVHVFFCISGFVMIYTSFCHDAGPFTPGDFLLKRVLRIYPIYWLCAAAYVLFHLAANSPYVLGPVEVLGALLLVPDHAAAIIGPAWTLAFEMYFYLCFCVFMLAGLRIGLIAMSAFFSVFIALGAALPQLALPPVMTNSLLMEFVAGAWLGWLAIVRPAVLARWWPVTLLAGTIGFAVAYATGYARFPSAFAWGVPSLLLLAGFVGLEASGRLPRAFASLAFLGDGSYFLYLSHILLIDVALLTPLTRLRESTGGVVAATVVVAIVCTLLSIVAYARLERPMLRRLRRLFRRTQAVVD